MNIGNFEIGRPEISIALVIFFAMVVMFFIGYYYAYTKAVNYANEQIEEKIDEFRAKNNLWDLQNPDIVIGNIKLPGDNQNES